MSKALAIEPIAISAKDAAKATGMAVRTLQDMAKNGKIPAKRVGKRLLFPLGELRDYINNLPSAAESVN